jgi:hypothetical protein
VVRGALAWLYISRISIIYNEHNCLISDVWVVGELKLSFRRCFNKKLLGLWDELVAIVQDLVLANEEDQMVWKVNSSRVYSSQYVVLNFRRLTLAESGFVTQVCSYAPLHFQPF